MGRYRFKLSDVIPNAWFYKLKDMGNGGAKNGPKGAATIPKHTKKTPTTTAKAPFPPAPPSPVKRHTGAINPGRASYYIPRPDEGSPDFPFHPKALDTKFLAETPRKSKKKSRKPAGRPSTKLVRSSVSSHCSCRGATLGSMWKEEPSLPEYPPHPASPKPLDDDFDGLPCSEKPVIAEHSSAPSRSSSSCSSRVTSSPPLDNTTLDLSSSKSSVAAGDVDLPPILTKPDRKDAESCGQLEPTSTTPTKKPTQRRRPYEGGRVRVRGNSPRLASCKKQLQGRKHRNVISGGIAVTPRKLGLSGGFAVVKASSDPRKDFRESMLEMIVENGIRTSKDLEDLLACYLSLNSADYHDVIVQVFQQIWFDLTATNVVRSTANPPPLD